MPTWPDPDALNTARRAAEIASRHESRVAGMPPSSLQAAQAVLSQLDTDRIITRSVTPAVSAYLDMVRRHQGQIAAIARAAHDAQRTVAQVVEQNPDLTATLIRIAQAQAQAQASPRPPDYQPAELAEELAADPEFLDILEHVDTDQLPTTDETELNFVYLSAILAIYAALQAFILRRENPDLFALLDDVAWASALAALIFKVLSRQQPDAGTDRPGS